MRIGFKSNGQVRLVGANVAGDLDCSSGQFKNAEETALAGDGVKIGGAVYLRDGFESDGEVRLLGATIVLDLDCTNGQFINTKTNADSFAILAEGAKINGNLFLRNGFKADGKVSFISTSVTRQFHWRGVKSPQTAVVDLCSMKVGTFWDDKESWPQSGNLFLNGFVYDEIHHSSPIDSKSRINWIKRQPSSQFLPQPYEQLAGVLRKMGHEDESIEVMIAKNDEIARRGRLIKVLINFLFKSLVGYGYRPGRAFNISFLSIVLGTIIFSLGNRVGIMTPTKEDAYISTYNGVRQISENYPKFNAFVYSLETFTPFLKLDMADYWRPNANRGEIFVVRGFQFPFNGSLLRGFQWFYIIWGWVLTTLWVGGLTGLLKR